MKMDCREISVDMDEAAVAVNMLKVGTFGQLSNCEIFKEGTTPLSYVEK
jgi:hypothetical protein